MNFFESIKRLFEYSVVIMPSMMEGMCVTLSIFALTWLIAIPFGLVISLMSMSKLYIFKIPAKLYVWVLRGTPLMLQLFFVYFALPAFGIVLDRFPAAVTAFILNYSAYFAEIYRGGIQSIDRGQYEAAKVLGMTKFQTMMRIIIPQTLRRIIPAISNETITLVKDTALVTAIGVSELLKVAKSAVNRDVNTMGFVIAAIIYLLLTLILTAVFKHLEKRFSTHERSE